MPAYGGIITDTTTVGLFNTSREFTKLGIKNSLLTVANESLLCRGRSKLLSFFYNETDFERLIFIDSDVGFTPDDILKLYELDVDFACAGVPLKTAPDIKYNFGVLQKDNKLIWNEQKSALQVDYVGTAFMMLTRNVYRELSKAHPELKYIPSRTHTNRAPNDASMNNSYYLFKTEITQAQDLLGEDYSFCRRWRNLGKDIWLRPDIQLTHTGSHVFRGTNLQEIFKNQ